MTELPAADAPASEWGALAVSIPGWRGPWACSHTEVCPPMPGFVLFEGAVTGWCYTDDITSAARIRVSPDPDHWAWWGWMLRLLGPERIAVSMWVDHITVGTDNLVMDDSAFGRACIAAAAAVGRWPGGEG